MSNITIGIHQPNFFPWLGFFNKILNSDIFVFLDGVQYTKGSYTNRVKILNQKVPSWITCPVNSKRDQSIREIQIDETQQWREKIKRIIQSNYKMTDFYSENFEFISNLIDREDHMLSDYNRKNIEDICSILDIKTKIILQPKIETTKKATELIIEITQTVGGTSYICGMGSKKYQDDQKFSENDIILIHQDFINPRYPQKTSTTFVEGLSIIDVLLNCGIDGTKKLLKQNFYEPK